MRVYCLFYAQFLGEVSTNGHNNMNIILDLGTKKEQIFNLLFDISL